VGNRSVFVVVALAVAVGFAGCDWVLGVHKFPPADAACSVIPGPPVGLVQQATAGSAAARTLDGNLSCPPMMGDVLVIAGAAVNNELDKPTGGGVTTWSSIDRSNQQANVELWIGVVDTTPSAVEIACSMCTATEQMWMLITEWSGLVNDNLVEAKQRSAGTGSGVATTAAVSTLHAPDLLIFGVSTTANSATDIPGWTALDVVKEDVITQYAWYQLTSTPGDYAASVAVTGRWDAVLGAVRAK